MGRLRQRRPRGRADLQVGLPPALQEHGRSPLQGRDRERGVAPVDERERGRVVRLRPGPVARPLRGGLLPLRHRLLAPEDHAHHGEQLRVRHQRGQEPPVSQSRGRTLRRCHRSDGGGQHPLDPGGRGGGLQRRRLARPVPGERLRPGRALPERPRPALHPEPRGPGERFQERHVGHAGRRAESRARGRLRDQHLGAQLGDLDNGGRNDLFIVNGYVSGDRDRSYWYAASKIAGAYSGVFEDARAWPAIGTASLSGYERSRVLVNRGLAGWSDVASRVGVTDEYDRRAIVLADLFNRGVLDVVIANQKQPALVYKNSVAPGNHWIAFKLVGTRSNHSAIGAEVTLETGATRQLQTVDGGMGFASQNDRRLHFGLGRSGRADRVVIRWPSGTVQTLEHLAVDRLHVITEPDR